MLPRIEDRTLVSLFVCAVTGAILSWLYPFPVDDPLWALIYARAPHVFFIVRGSYDFMLFSTPFLCASALLSLGLFQRLSRKKPNVRSELPPYPDPGTRKELYAVVAEVHDPRTGRQRAHPRWLVIPLRGLFTGIAAFGAIGSGKTTGVMYPIVEQLLAFMHRDPLRRVGGLFLEVKGDFCKKIKEILEKYGRAEDYIELTLDSENCCNPLQSNLDPYALAYGIATLLTSLFGKGREPFWQQAYTNMMKFIILLHRLLYDYVTLFDVYQCAIDPTVLDKRIKEGEEKFAKPFVVWIEVSTYLLNPELSRFAWETIKAQMRTILTKELSALLKEKKIAHQIEELAEDPSTLLKRQMFEAVLRWFRDDWMRIEQRLRTSIVEGIAFFLSMFDANPDLKRVFCPPKECYDPVLNADGKYGNPLPPFSELIEQGKVVAFNFPTSTNPGLARLMATLTKSNFQGAVLERIPKIEVANPDDFRPVFFGCDEYHMFATAGESDPTGDEKFFSLSRQARCIPIVATQSVSSLRSALPGETWRTLLQTFRTKIFLTTSDDFTARVASELCGKDDHLKLTYNLSESGQDAGVGIFTGRTTAERASVSASKSYSIQRDLIFEPRVFMELKNVQAIILAYDGLNPLPPTYCYLKPYFLNREVSYFEQLARGEL